MRFRIRKNSLLDDLYLARNGEWTDWRNAASL